MTDCAVAGALARRFAESAGLDGRRSAEVAIAAGELASNIVKHGGARGRIALRKTRNALHVVALDSGPGLSDAAAPEGVWRLGANSALVGLGEGLAAVARLLDAVKRRNRRCGGLLVHGVKHFATSRSVR